MSVTGRGADFVVLDDPINPKESGSPTIRTDINDTISKTIPTRFNDLRIAKWLLIMQRLHSDDPTGHFTGDDRWFKLLLPGENLTGKTIRYELNGKVWKMEPASRMDMTRFTPALWIRLRKEGCSTWVAEQESIA